MSSEVTVAISGKSGCGNTTVSRELARRLGLRLINYTFHDMARERGLSFEEFYRLVQQDTQYDRYLDQHQVELAAGGGCVLASRLAIWLLPRAHLRVYLGASAEARARRIARREGTDWQQALEELGWRDARDRERYLSLYEIDVDEYGFADLIVDTERGGPEYVVEEILKALQAKPAREGEGSPG
jgi:cytidylate kinase